MPSRLRHPLKLLAGAITTIVLVHNNSATGRCNHVMARRNGATARCNHVMARCNSAAAHCNQVIARRNGSMARCNQVMAHYNHCEGHYNGCRSRCARCCPAREACRGPNNVRQTDKNEDGRKTTLKRVARSHSGAGVSEAAKTFTHRIAQPEAIAPVPRLAWTLRMSPLRDHRPATTARA